MGLERFDIPSVIHAYNFPRWKHPVVRQCFPDAKIIFLKTTSPVPTSGWLIVWGMTEVPAGLSGSVTVLRMEDGFLRSVGLGADIIRPVSWVLDKRGIYYDATRESDLEYILATHDFKEALLARAKSLREQLVSTGITKYNTGQKLWQRPAENKRVILVVGQVESDASLKYGAPGERTNIGLLKRVYKEHQDAHVVYKPHPDVVARMRLEGTNENEAASFCHEVVTDVGMGQLLTQVDEVHVITSLAGFEALLRGKQVTCHGHPFYAGWGLTRDLIPVPRRTRRLTLDVLVAGALIEYPLYLSRDGKSLISPEAAVTFLLQWRQSMKGKDHWWRALARIVIRRVAGVK